MQLYKILFETKKILDTKGKRYNAYFYGSDNGEWEYHSAPIFSFKKNGYDWEMASSLSSRNEWRNFSVEGTTEYNEGFIEALKNIVKEYPEVLDFEISFDGPAKPIKNILDRFSNIKTQEFQNIVFYHGTSSHFLNKIMEDGLKPRLETGSTSVYGAMEAGESNPRYVYLTTQLGMAHYAAISSAARYKSIPIILKVTNLTNNDLFRPDEDSKETDAYESLKRLGSVAYEGSISPDKIEIFESLIDNNWIKHS